MKIKFKCVICEKTITGYGNNPEPIKHKGKCCDYCNFNIVIPTRFGNIKKMENLKNREIAEAIMNTKEYLSKEEYDFCFANTDDVRIDTSYIGEYSQFGDYLNLRVYSEHDHEKWQELIEQLKERGI